MKAIDTWADAEIERIQSERERRITTRRGELAQRLEDHRLLIGREVDAVEAAIAAYRTEVEVYFSRLDAERIRSPSPARPGRRPVFPARDSVAGRPRRQRRPTRSADQRHEPPAGDGPVAYGPDRRTDRCDEADPASRAGEARGRRPASPDDPGEPAETKAESVGDDGRAERRRATKLGRTDELLVPPRGDEAAPDQDA